jgi:F-type H+-transporting ATPase subunit gamma
VASRPFAQRMQAVLNSLAGRVDPDSHPLLRAGGAGGRPMLIVVTADRGLCGSFNSNVIKAAGQFILTQTRDGGITLGLIGRKGRDFFRRRGFDVRTEQVGIFQRLAFSHAAEIANTAIDDFVSGRASSVHIVYNEFKSVMSQRLVVEQLLPVPRPEPAAQAGPTVDYLYEPGPEEIFRDLLPRYVQAQVYRALLESNAAFFAAQMTAMDAATRNSAEMLENLTLYMNKVRQAAITREIIEVVSGAAAR